MGDKQTYIRRSIIIRALFKLGLTFCYNLDFNNCATPDSSVAIDSVLTSPLFFIVFKPEALAKWLKSSLAALATGVQFSSHEQGSKLASFKCVHPDL